MGSNHDNQSVSRDEPGRIPESLIDAVLDGAVDEQTQREVTRALRHDPSRRRDLEQAQEAIDALRTPIECPDFSSGVLNTLDRRHRFIPLRARRAMRRTRMGVGLAALLALGGVAIGQRHMPRLASLGTPTTPVSDVASALCRDAGGMPGEISEDTTIIRATVPLLQRERSVIDRRGGELMATLPGFQPGVSYRFDVAHTVETSPAQYRLVSIGGGRLMLVHATAAQASFSSAGYIRGTTGAAARGATEFARWGLVGESVTSGDRSEQSEQGDAARSGRSGWVAQDLP